MIASVMLCFLEEQHKLFMSGIGVGACLDLRVAQQLMLTTPSQAPSSYWSNRPTTAFESPVYTSVFNGMSLHGGLVSSASL